MSTSTTDEEQDAEVIELEPTMQFETAEPWASRAGSSSFGPEAVMAAAEASHASISGEMVPLLRSRLAAVSLLLAVASAILLIFHVIRGTEHVPFSWFLLSARFVLPAVIAGVLLSPLALSVRWLRVLEYALFGGMTLIVVTSEYTINLWLMQHHDYPAMVAFVKNGVINMVVLMFLYGTFIPNKPKTVAWVVLSMALLPMLSLAILTEHPDASEALSHFQSAEQTGSNALFLLIAAGMSIFGSVILSGLRSELHVARKFGQYQLVRKLGEGGMGEVYLAEHSLLKRPCALKLIKPEAGTDPVAMARFEREVQSAARLAHPNSIEIFDYGLTGDGTFYYVMEYLQGKSLADLVRTHGPIPAGRVIYLFRQVCAGLAEAHGLGLVHRDLKPANVFVAVRGGESDVSKVLDFGLVKLTRDPGAANLTSDMTVSGTPMFMAPEQTVGDRSLDARADIYALGAMMYHALTGRPPFTGENAFEIMMAHSRDPVVPPSQINSSVPADLEQVVLRCLAKKPEDRFPSARALGQAPAACDAASEWGANRAEAWWAAEGMVVRPDATFVSPKPVPGEPKT
jgi:eukaryotic-like serine/threonine-protein kinase